MARIRLEHVTKRFGGAGLGPLLPAGRGPARAMRMPGDELPAEAALHGVLALDDVSLVVEDGEVMGVLGPSGCGKTTLLRVVAGLEQPDSGKVYYDDQDMAGIEPKDRGIGIVFQNYALYPHMESRGNLSFFFWMHKREREIPERVRIVSEMMGIGFAELLDRKPKQLSGGQQQRVAIARCIVRDPKLFLFDEPFSNLDAALRQRTRVELKRLLMRFRITTLYVTHDQSEAQALCDRIAVMRAGRIEQVGTYRELYSRPVNTFVAGFIGVPPMSLFAGTVEEMAGKAWIRLKGGHVAVPPGVDGLIPGRVVTVGVRAEDVHVVPLGADVGPSTFFSTGSTARLSTGPPRLVGEIEVSEPLFAERVQLLTISLGGERCIARVPLEERWLPGEHVEVLFRPEGMHLFDEEGRRLGP
jgi:ABC-type sugar transport system ATPase subunit